MRQILQVLVLALVVLGGALVAAPQTPSPIVVLVSFDGWRWDYTDRAHAPNLRALAARGVRAEGLIPSFPSKTFPNHYTVVTGLYPEHHGIISNSMTDPVIGARFSMSAPTAKDPRWWGGEPLWVTAIKQGRRASSMFWPGAEVEIHGVRPTAWEPYDDHFPNADRVTRVLDWLALPERERPSFVTLYFSDVDTIGHRFGPDRPETLEAAAGLDRLLGDLLAGVETLGLSARVNIVMVSDHGMSQQSDTRKIYLEDYIDLTTVDVVDWSPVLQIAPKTGSVDALYRALRGKHPALEVYRREEIPGWLHYTDSPRIQPIVGIAADGWGITTRERFVKTNPEWRAIGGEHGYPGRYRSMQGLFIAAGPLVREGLTVPAFDNIHIYDLMCRMLGLTPAKNDGDPSVTARFIRD